MHQPGRAPSTTRRWTGRARAIGRMVGATFIKSVVNMIMAIWGLLTSTYGIMTEFLAITMAHLSGNGGQLQYPDSIGALIDRLIPEEYHDVAEEHVALDHHRHDAQEPLTIGREGQRRCLTETDVIPPPTIGRTFTIVARPSNEEGALLRSRERERALLAALRSAQSRATAYATRARRDSSSSPGSPQHSSTPIEQSAEISSPTELTPSSAREVKTSPVLEPRCKSPSASLNDDNGNCAKVLSLSSQTPQAAAKSQPKRPMTLSDKLKQATMDSETEVRTDKKKRAKILSTKNLRQRLNAIAPLGLPEKPVPTTPSPTLVRAPSPAPPPSPASPPTTPQRSSTTGSETGKSRHSPTTNFVLSLTLMFLVLTSWSEGKEQYDGSRQVTEGQKKNIVFTAFECSVPKLVFDNNTRPEVKAIDLTAVRPCLDPDEDYLKPIEQTVTLVQSHVPLKIQITRCRLLLTAKSQRHGHYSAMFKDRFYGVNEPVIIGSDTCLEARKYMEFTCTSRVCGGGKDSPTVKLKLGKTTTISWDSEGGFDGRDNAIQATFYKDLNGVREKNYARLAQAAQFFLDDTEGFYDAMTGKVWSDKFLFQGEYHRGSAWTIDFGLFAWNVTKDRNRCQDSLARVATEVAEVHRVKPDLRGEGPDHEYDKAMVVIHNDTSHRATGMIIKTSSPECLPDCHKTNIPFLLLCIKKEGVLAAETLPTVESRPSSRIGRLNLNGLSSYSTLTHRLDLYETRRELLADICRLDIRGIQQDLASIVNVNNQYALEDINIGDPIRQVQGRNINSTYSITVRGSVAYLLECTPVAVQLIEIEECTQQIPVVVVGDDHVTFVDAINYHITEVPTIVQCTKSLPVMYRIAGEYFCHSPDHQFCPKGSTPSVLAPATGQARGIRADELPAIGGLTFSTKQLEVIRVERQKLEYGPIANSILASRAITATLDPSTGHAYTMNLGLPLTDIDLERIKMQVASKMFVLVNIFGQAYLHVFGAIVLYTIGSHFLGCAVRMWYVYRVRGCGMWIPKAMFSSVFATGTLPGIILKTVLETTQKVLATAKDDAMPPPQYDQFVDRLELLEEKFKRYKWDRLDEGGNDSDPTTKAIS